MASWFSRRPKRVSAPKLGSRAESVTADRAELEEFTPPLRQLLGRAAYVQLALFENLGRTVAAAPTTAGKASLAECAELSLGKHRALVDELEKLGDDPAAAMEPYRAGLDEFQRITQGGDWFESVLTCYLTAGFLDDFYARLASGLDEPDASRLTALFTAPSGEEQLAGLLAEAMDDNPRLASRLALWGRRLLGDTMLAAKDSLQHRRAGDDAQIEPVFTELIAAHTRRMDALGLTA